MLAFENYFSYFSTKPYVVGTQKRRLDEEKDKEKNNNKHHSGLQIRVCNRKSISYFSTKTYVVGTQKNRLDETVLLSTQNKRLK